MNSLIVVLAFVGCALAQVRPYRPVPVPVPQPGGPVIGIRSQSQEVNFDGTYQYAYETENGISVQEQGQPKSVPGSPEPAEEVNGAFEYTNPEGERVQVSYVANENGFQPQGSHIPTPPPTPLAILRALEYNAAHPEQDEEQPQRQPPRRFK